MWKTSAWSLGLTLGAVTEEGAGEGLGADPPVQTRHCGALVDVLFTHSARESQRACAGKGAWRPLGAQAAVPTRIERALVNVPVAQPAGVAGRKSNRMM